MNPAAAGGRLGREWPGVERYLGTLGVTLRTSWTKESGHAEELAATLVEEGAQLVVAAGGDGTALEVARGLARVGAGTLAILPVGTGNDVARMLGVPRRMRSWVAWFESARRISIDLLELDGTPFLNAFGLGLLGSVSERASRLKGARGPFAYLLAGGLELVQARPVAIRLRAEEIVFEGPLLALAIQNGATSGGGFCFCPGSEVADGRFDATWVGELPLRSRPGAIFSAYRGRLERIPSTGRGRFTRLEIDTASEVWIHLDGEPQRLNPGPHQVSLRPASLSVLAAPTVRSESD